MLKIGNINELVVLRFIEEGLYLDAEDWEVFLPHDEVPEGTKEGDTLEVMIYLDQDGSPLATTDEPLAEVGEFACLRVVGATESGAFLNWGIEKDLYLPIREQRFPVSRGEDVVVWLFLDPRNGKPTASTRLDRFLTRDPSELLNSQKVQIMVFDKSELGYRVVIEGHWSGLLYHEQTSGPLAIGEVCTAYVMKVREDGKVDVSLRSRGKAAREEGRELILAALTKGNGYIPYHDKSPADVIEKALGVSKKKFKMITGELYKYGIILLEPEGIRLAPTAKEAAPLREASSPAASGPSAPRAPRPVGAAPRPPRPAAAKQEGDAARPPRAPRSDRPEQGKGKSPAKKGKPYAHKGKPGPRKPGAGPKGPKEPGSK